MDARTTPRQLAASLRDSENNLQAIIDTTVDGIICIDHGGQITLFNPAAERLFGYTREEVMGRNVSLLMPDEIAARHDHYIERYRASGQTRVVGTGREITGKRKDGTTFPAQLSLSEVSSNAGSGPCFTGIVRDITEQKAMERKLRQHAAVFRHAKEAIMIMDAASRITEVNEAFTQVTGYSAHEVVGHTAALVLVDPHGPEFGQRPPAALLKSDGWCGDSWALDRKGEVFPVWITVAAVTDEFGDVQQHISLFTDISERKREEQTIRFRAHHDPLTGLANRVLFLEMCEHARERARRHGGQFALIYLDLDRFKPVNDSLGHDAGDELLRQVAERLRAEVRHEDTVARVGGDEFTILLEDIRHRDCALLVAGKVVEALDRPFTIGAHPFSVGASLGVSLFPDHGADTDALMRAADTAMYRAKATPGSRWVVHGES